MTREVLTELRRYVRATAAPFTVVAAILSARRLLDGFPITAAPLTEAAAAVWVGALSAAVAWLVRAIVVAVLQPRRDRRASERLQAIREHSHAPGHALLAIEHVAWIGAAGQRVHALDVRHGTVHDLWLSEVALPVGSFAVFDLTADPLRVIDWLDHPTVARARGHDALAAARQQRRARRPNRAVARRERDAAAAVIEEAERLLRAP